MDTTQPTSEEVTAAIDVLTRWALNPERFGEERPRRLTFSMVPGEDAMRLEVVQQRKASTP